MYILSIPGNNVTSQANKDNVDDLIKNKKHVFILVYM